MMAGLFKFSRLILLALVMLPCLLPVGVRSATLPVFENRGLTNNAQVDATVFLNSGQFNVFSSVPYGTLNTQYFTNDLSGIMTLSPGFNYEFIANNQRMRARSFVNLGTIGVSGGGLSSQFGGGILTANAEEISIPGNIVTESGGLVRLLGNNVNLVRSVLSTASTNISGFAAGSNGTTNYINPINVEDIYWGAGTAGVMFIRGSFPINFQFNTFLPPNSSSPTHEVVWPANFGTTLVSLPSVFGGNFASYMWTNVTGPTNIVIQVVQVATNSANTNMSIDVRFLSSGFRADPMIRFALPDLDIISGNQFTNYLFFTDSTIDLTNATLADNLDATTFRPRGFSLSRSPFDDFIFTFFAQRSNDTQTASTFFQPGFTNSSLTNYRYAAYAAKIGTPRTTFIPVPGDGGNLALSDPTNLAGRVEIVADNLDMRLSRIRAENTITIRTTNLISSTGSILDAPNVNFSVANDRTTIALTNFVPARVPRLNGTLQAYSARWTNQFQGIQIAYQLLMVDASLLSDFTSVSLPELRARATNIVVQNILNAGRSLVFDSPTVTFNAGTELNLNSVTIPNLVASNFPSLVHFTNAGIISIPGDGRFGSDRPTPISNLVNSGIISANTLNFRVDALINSGTNITGSIFGGGGGPIDMEVNSAKLEAIPERRGMYSSGGNITLKGNSFKIRQHTIQTASTMFLAPTNSITDTGLGASNVFSVGLGFHLLVKPLTGDLIGSEFRTTIPLNRQINHSWAGNDFGPFGRGYSNNMAISKLVIDTSANTNANNLASFNGISTNNALYTDFLELRGNVTNRLASHLEIGTNLTIYFANANVPVEQLDGKLGGRLRWVKDFAGPTTSVDVRLPDGRLVKVNVAKLNSRIVDSDGDGIANANDVNPFDGVIFENRVTVTNLPPPSAIISWRAAANTIYEVQVNTNSFDATWRTVAFVTNTTVTNGVISYADPLPVGNPQRFYRVTYQP